MRGSLTCSEFAFLAACAVALEQRHRPAGEASLRPKCGNYLTRTLCAHHRGSGEIIQDRQCHETRNVLGPWHFFGKVGSGATGPSPAIRRCFGVRLLCSPCATSGAVAGKHAKAARWVLPDGPGPGEALASFALCCGASAFIQ